MNMSNTGLIRISDIYLFGMHIIIKNKNKCVFKRNCLNCYLFFLFHFIYFFFLKN